MSVTYAPVATLRLYSDVSNLVHLHTLLHSILGISCSDQYVLGTLRLYSGVVNLMHLHNLLNPNLGILALQQPICVSHAEAVQS